MARLIAVQSPPRYYFVSIWSGALATIPDGYQLCDGTNGTPDLRDRFILGSGPPYTGTRDGADEQDLSHSHLTSHLDVVSPGTHTHAIADTPSGIANAGVSGGIPDAPDGFARLHTHGMLSTRTENSTAHYHHSPYDDLINWTGTLGKNESTLVDIRPPYYALAYISGPGEPPVGGIIGYGKITSYGDIPAGYAICDGSGGTPNLMSYFIVGAGGSYALGASGEGLVETPAHNHGIGSLTALGETTDHGHSDKANTGPAPDPWPPGGSFLGPADPAHQTAMRSHWHSAPAEPGWQAYGSMTGDGAAGHTHDLDWIGQDTQAGYYPLVALVYLCWLKRIS